MPGGGDESRPAETLLHGTCVALNGRGMLFTGPSGSGKSALALTLMAYGAVLVSDDQVMLRRQGDVLTAEPPAPIRGLIEARGVGLLQAEVEAPVRIDACVDLTRAETDRLPRAHSREILGVSVPLLFNIPAAHFAPALIQYLRMGLRQTG